MQGPQHRKNATRSGRIAVFATSAVAILILSSLPVSAHPADAFAFPRVVMDIVAKLATATRAQVENGTTNESVRNALLEYDYFSAQNYPTMALGAVMRAQAFYELAAYEEKRDSTHDDARTDYIRLQAVLRAAEARQYANATAKLVDTDSDPVPWKEFEARLFVALFAGQSAWFAKHNELISGQAGKGETERAIIMNAVGARLNYLFCAEFAARIRELGTSTIEIPHADLMRVANESYAIYKAPENRNYGGPTLREFDDIMQASIASDRPIYALGVYLLSMEYAAGLRDQVMGKQGYFSDPTIGLEKAANHYEDTLAMQPSDFLGLVVLDRYQQATAVAAPSPEAGALTASQPAVGPVMLMKAAFDMYGSLGMHTERTLAGDSGILFVLLGTFVAVLLVPITVAVVHKVKRRRGPGAGQAVESRPDTINV